MGGALDEVMTRPRITLAGIVAVGLAILAPSLLFAAIDSPAPLSLVVVALALAALGRLGAHGAVLATRTAAPRPLTRGQAPPLFAGRITDPTHQPLRPRAPGMA